MVMSAVDGTVKKVDTDAKTITVDTARGTEQTFHYFERTSVHGAEAGGKASGKTFHGLREGDKLAVHYTTQGGERTAHEIDRIGEGGLKPQKALFHTSTGIQKAIAIKTGEGGEETFRLSDRAAKDTGRDIAAGLGKSAKV